MQNNKSIFEAFDLIDTDQSQTISIQELTAALIRFNLNLSDQMLKQFLTQLDPDHKGYLSKHEWIQRFWAAYTYEETDSTEASSSDENGEG